MRRVIGLTGGMGMGKSATAALLAAEGAAVWDADAAVARLYGPGEAGAAAVAALAPGAVGPEGVDRAALRAAIAADPSLLPRLEAAIHPLVAVDREEFLARYPEGLVVLDVPLLYETGLDALVDDVVAVSCPPEVQRARILTRGTLDEAAIDLLLARQATDADRRARARWVVDTSTPERARRDVAAILRDLQGA